MKRIKQLLSLLLALLLALPLTGLAAEKLSPIEQLGAQLVQAQSDLDRAKEILAGTQEDVARLEQKYEKNPNNAKIQDQLIDAMIAVEAAEDAYAGAFATLLMLQETQSRMAEEAECEDLIVEYEGKYADLLVTATVDENMVLYGLTAEVDGSDRDQLVAQNSYLYQFIGKDIPLTIGDKKTDDVAPLKDAQQTAKDLVAALNSLVYTESEENGSKAPNSPIIEPQAIADYIFKHGRLPDNFITKKEAQKLGWDSSRNYVSDVAPGKSIGGDRFGNYEGLLPSKKGRTWYEADCYYTKGKRNAHRILYSNDGLVYYTDDHYESFTKMYPSK
jgi:hypothetical protein